MHVIYKTPSENPKYESWESKNFVPSAKNHCRKLPESREIDGYSGRGGFQTDRIRKEPSCIREVKWQIYRTKNSTKEEYQLTCKEKSIIIIRQFSTETKSSKGLEQCQARLFRKADRYKLKEFMATKPELQHIFEGLLHTEKEERQIHEATTKNKPHQNSKETEDQESIKHSKVNKIT